MLEWLTRDPLNGIVITIAFFSSLIIGRYLRNKKDKAEHSGKMIDPRVKIFVSFLLIIAVTLMKHWYFPILIAALCIVIALKINVIRDYLKKLVFPLVLALFILAVQGFFYGVNKIDLGIIPVYSEGMDYGFLIFARVFASASVLILLVITISENDMLESMRWFGVPKTVIEISSLMARYIKTFSIEGKKLKLAQESRLGFSKNSGFLWRMHNISSISGSLINRAFLRSEHVHRAMLSRCWNLDSRYLTGHMPFNKRDIFLGIMISTGIFALVGFDWLLW